jgi:hypothetical protein
MRAAAIRSPASPCRRSSWRRLCGGRLPWAWHGENHPEGRGDHPGVYVDICGELGRADCECRMTGGANRIDHPEALQIKVRPAVVPGECQPETNTSWWPLVAAAFLQSAVGGSDARSRRGRASQSARPSRPSAWMICPESFQAKPARATTGSTRRRKPSSVAMVVPACLGVSHEAAARRVAASPGARHGRRRGPQ